MAWSDAARAAALEARRRRGPQSKGARARTARLTAAGYTPKVMDAYHNAWVKKNNEAKAAIHKIVKEVAALPKFKKAVANQRRTSVNPRFNWVLGKAGQSRFSAK